MSACRDSVRAYELGICLAGAAVALFLSLLDLELTRAIYAPATDPLSAALRTTTLLSAISLAISAVSIPRRPQVYLDGQPVERHLTVSARERFTYTWCHELLRLAKAKQDLDITDFPALDHHTRSFDQSAAWRSLPFQPRLWRALFRAYRGKVVQQWGLAIVKGVINYAPHVCLLKFLETIEKGSMGGRWPLEAWFLVFALVLSMLIDGVSQKDW